MIATVTSTTIVPLDGITSADEPHAGAKAYNCARLKQAGFAVPDGLVVLSTAPDADLTDIDAHPWFDAMPADAVFAVRSSGIGEDGEGESFAGIHQTLLNVRRGEIRDAVAVCRASAFAPHALEYRRAKHLPLDGIRMGVLVQRMVQPIAAGVAFTVNPMSGSPDEMVINASWGLGEALVSGQIDPDEFLVSKPSGDLLGRRIGEKADGAAAAPSLAAAHVRELAAILVRIERHYGGPQDVEWCHDGRAFWIVQSRPITTRAVAHDEIEWTRANLMEVLPDLTSPITLSTFEDMLNVAERKFLGTLLGPEETLGPMLKSFGGRPYFNLTQLRHVCAVTGVAPAEMLKSMGHPGAITTADEQAIRPPLRVTCSALPDFVRILRLHRHAPDVVRRHETKTREYLAALASRDPRALSDSEIWKVLEDWRHAGPDSMEPVLLLSGVSFLEAPVRKLCAKVGFPFERLMYPLLAAGQRSVSAQQAFDLVALADVARSEPRVAGYLRGDVPDLPALRAALAGTAFLAAFDRFLDTYGHRGRYESDIALPRYREDPAPLLHAIRAHVDSEGPRTSATGAQQAQAAEDAWRAFERHLSVWRRWTALPRVRRAVVKIKRYYVWREQVRSDLVRVLFEIRARHLTLAERFVARGWLDRRDDYFLLHVAEIDRVIRGERAPHTLRTIAANRRAESERYRALDMPLLMRESQLAQLTRMSRVRGVESDERELTGNPVSGGAVEAEVVVIRDPADFGRMTRGAILVAPATDPSWTPLFTLASGVIVEVGGVLSHASTIAREYGLPALANVKHATTRLRTGERVKLDATNGVIVRLNGAA